MTRLPPRIVASALALIALTGCTRDTWSYRAVPNINISEPNEIGSEGPVVLKIEPAGPNTLPPSVMRWIQEHRTSVPTHQTVLVAAWQHDWNRYETTVGQTLVIMLEGPPKPGKTWLNPDNAVLVAYSSYSAPTRLRASLSGSINILSVKPNQIQADLAVLDTTDIDDSQFVDAPWDPIYHQWPFVLTGTRTFAITTPDDPLFSKTGVRWTK